MCIILTIYLCSKYFYCKNTLNLLHLQPMNSKWYSYGKYYNCKNILNLLHLPSMNSKWNIRKNTMQYLSQQFLKSIAPHVFGTKDFLFKELSALPGSATLDLLIGQNNCNYNVRRRVLWVPGLGRIIAITTFGVVFYGCLDWAE